MTIALLNEFYNELSCFTVAECVPYTVIQGVILKLALIFLVFISPLKLLLELYDVLLNIYSKINFSMYCEMTSSMFDASSSASNSDDYICMPAYAQSN